MSTAVAALIAMLLAMLGAFWLPDPATRTQGIVSVAVAAVLAVYGFRAVESIWPRPKPPVGPEVERSSAARLAGWMWLVVGVALIVWALIDVWTKPFAWNQAWRWFAGLLMAVVGSYLLGGQEIEEGSRRSEVGGRRSEPGRGAPLRSPPEAAGAVWEAVHGPMAASCAAGDHHGSRHLDARVQDRGDAARNFHRRNQRRYGCIAYLRRTS